jgi:hypothetical protein
MLTALVLAVLILMALKAISLMVFLDWIVRYGSRNRRSLLERRCTLSDWKAGTYTYKGRIELAERVLSSLPGPAGTLANVIYSIPVIITLGSATVLLGVAVSGSSPELLVALGLATGFVTFAQLFSCVLRQLVLGHLTYYMHDLQVPVEGWATTEDRGANVQAIFVMLVYLAFAGFAALDAAIWNINNDAFTITTSGRSALTWLYFSAVAVSTVGFGDIHARSSAAQAVVLVQTLSGPLLLSWLVASVSSHASMPGSDLNEPEIPDNTPAKAGLAAGSPRYRAARDPVDGPRQGKLVHTEQVKAHILNQEDTFVLADIASSIGGSLTTIRRAVSELIESGHVEKIGPMPDWKARGRAPNRYHRV